jgi:hypothetical protein
MTSQKSGTEGDQNAVGDNSDATAQQSPAPADDRQEHVPNYLVQAVVVTLLCCLPFGIVAIVYAAQVNGKLATDDLEGAKRYSAFAKLWCWIAFWTGIAVYVLWLSTAGTGVWE